jgi:HEAT repeat protein
LEDDSEEVRAEAAHALGRFDGTSAAALRREISDPDRAVRRAAVRALGRHAGAEAVPDLLFAADSEAAGDALAHMAGRFPEVESALLIGWERCGHRRRRTIARALAATGSAAALDQLRRWLRHPRRAWRWRALPLIVPFLPVVPALAQECVTALDDAHVRVRLAALRAVRSRAGPGCRPCRG